MNLRAYAAILAVRFQLLLQYRAAAVAGFFTQLFFGLVMVMVFQAFYRASGAPQPMSYEETVTYIWIAQAFFRLYPISVDSDVAGLIRSGNVAYELMRPLDLYALWYARCVALLTAPVLLRAVPMLVVAALVLQMQLPSSPLAGLAWVFAVGGAVLLSSAITLFMSISMLWTISGDGIVYLMGVCVMIFSGLMIPLPLFPDWAQTALRLLPFSGIMDLPSRLYMGILPPSALGMVLLHQLVWTVIFVALGRLMLARGLRRLVIQGG